MYNGKSTWKKVARPISGKVFSSKERSSFNNALAHPGY